MQLLEGIGAISVADRKNATSRRGNYQDSVTAPLSRAFDDDAVAQDDDEDEQELLIGDEGSVMILSAVEKVGTMFLCHIPIRI